MTTGEILVDKHNEINAETMSIVLANLLQGSNIDYIYEMHFGHGGTITDLTSNITYKDVLENLESGTVADLYSPLFYKVVDPEDAVNNEDETRNNIAVSHADGLHYTDIVVTCTLEENQPETAVGTYDAGELVFDEIGLKSKGASGLNTGYLLSHIVFNPVEKDPGRVIQVVYTLRISL
jgi:hypothetical protein